MRKRKGRQGESCNFAVLTAEKVGLIRNNYLSGNSQKNIAFVFCVSKSTISKIVSGKIWKSAHDGTDLRRRKQVSREEGIPE